MRKKKRQICVAGDCVARQGMSLWTNGVVPEWCCVGMVLCRNGVMSCDVKSGDVIYDDDQGYNRSSG